MPGSSLVKRERYRPLTSGSVWLFASLVGMWVVGTLTGASSAYIIFSTVLAFVVSSAVSGLYRMRRVRMDVVHVPAQLSTHNTSVLSIQATEFCNVRLKGASQYTEIAPGDTQQLEFIAENPGILSGVEVESRVSGWLQVVQWKRTHALEFPSPTLVIANPQAVDMPPESATSKKDVPSSQPHAYKVDMTGVPDGVRSWRQGDEAKMIHWRSSLRASELIVVSRSTAPPQVTAVVVDSNAEPSAELKRVSGLAAAIFAQSGIVLAKTTFGKSYQFASYDEFSRWVTQLLSPPASFVPAQVTPERLSTLSRLVSSATAAYVFMLMAFVQVLAWLPASVAVAAISASTVFFAVSAKPPSAVLRFAIQLGAISISIIYAFATTSGTPTPLELIRGPLPLIVVVLLVVHSLDVVDKRTLRFQSSATLLLGVFAISLSVSGLMPLAAVALVMLWMLTWIVCRSTQLAVSWHQLSSRKLRAGLSVSFAAALALASLLVIPVPAGSASFSFPVTPPGSFQVNDPGGLLTPTGNTPRQRNAGSSRSTTPGSSGSYDGFTDSLDTSVRGDLGDAAVMKVRANKPAFWRGQTFTDFDGRRWSSTATSEQRVSRDNTIINPSLGDVRPSKSIPLEIFSQTYFMQVDMTNLLFGAYRPTETDFAGDVWVQSDGTFRSTVTLPAGSVYSVVSNRPQVTSEILRSQGKVDSRLTDEGLSAFEDELAISETTTDRTIDLATELVGSAPTTYDGVLALEAWLGSNVEYDLDSPIPSEGADAVDDFLFESKRGFCEQIASSMVMMLRSQGIPARLAVGYASGSYDSFSGVFTVKASDAHAWAEVWFPEIGWQPFDPTAAVPLAGETSASSIGRAFISDIAEMITDYFLFILGAGLFLFVGKLSITAFRRRRHRRRIGWWGRAVEDFCKQQGHDLASVSSAKTISEIAGVEYMSAASFLNSYLYDPGFDVHDTELQAEYEKVLAASIK